MSNDSNDVRVGFDLPRDEHSQLDQLIPHGMRSQVLRVVCQMVVTFILKRGDIGLAMLLNGKVKLSLTDDAKKEITEWQD